MAVRAFHRLAGRIGFGWNHSQTRFHRRRHHGDLVINGTVFVVDHDGGSRRGQSQGEQTRQDDEQRDEDAHGRCNQRGPPRRSRIFRRHGRLQQPEIRAPGAAAQHDTNAEYQSHYSNRMRAGVRCACQMIRGLQPTPSTGPFQPQQHHGQQSGHQHTKL